MKIGAANRSQRDSDYCFANAGAWPLDFLDADVVLSVKNISFHFFHLIVSSQLLASCETELAIKRSNWAGSSNVYANGRCEFFGERPKLIAEYASLVRRIPHDNADSRRSRPTKGT